MAFVGRKRELAALEKLYATDAFQMPVVYGRRRVGKTSLIARFVEDKPAVVFTAQESSAKEKPAACPLQPVTRMSSMPRFPSTRRSMPRSIRFSVLRKRAASCS